MCQQCDRRRCELAAAQARERELQEAMGVACRWLNELHHYDLDDKDAIAACALRQWCGEVMQILKTTLAALSKRPRAALDALLEQARQEAYHRGRNEIFETLSCGKLHGTALMPCGHPQAAVRQDSDGAAACRWCESLEQARAEERGRILSQIEPLFDEWRRGDDGSDDYPPLGAFIAAAIRGEERNAQTDSA